MVSNKPDPLIKNSKAIGVLQPFKDCLKRGGEMGMATDWGSLGLNNVCSLHPRIPTMTGKANDHFFI